MGLLEMRVMVSIGSGYRLLERDQPSLPDGTPSVRGTKATAAGFIDNTIKMAERTFKHGRQWCIRTIHVIRKFHVF